MQHNTDHLIDTLTDNLRPVQGVWNPLPRTIVFFCAGLVYVGLSVVLLGLRSDIATVLSTPVFVFEIGLALMIALTAAIAAMWLALPDRGGWWHVYVIPVTLLVVFAFWSMVQPLARDVGAIGTQHWAYCLRDSVVFILIPLTVMLMINLRARTTSPLMTCAMNMLSISALGWCGLRLTCAIDTIGHGIIYHMLPFAGFAILAALFAKRLFRW